MDCRGKWPKVVDGFISNRVPSELYSYHFFAIRLTTNLQEDRLLLRAVGILPKPLRWSDVARLVLRQNGSTRRTAKQCRERYSNNLARSSLKQTEWTPTEDALLCRMYGLVGAKWVALARLLPGRNASGAKTRFHTLRQRLDRQAADHLSASESSIVPAPLKAKIMATLEKAKPHDDFLPPVANILAHALGTDNRLLLSPDEGYHRSFGPFHFPTKNEEAVQCERCGLLAPSSQTGEGVCKKTGWCVACAETTVFLRDDLLRLEHSLRATATSSSKRVSLGHEF